MKEMEVSNGDIVRVKSQGIVAVGPVDSCYGDFIYGKNNRIVAMQVAGIEMTDLSNLARPEARYWKAGDGGTVEVWRSEWPGKWEQIFPLEVVSE